MAGDQNASVGRKESKKSQMSARVAGARNNDGETAPRAGEVGVGCQPHKLFRPDVAKIT